MFDLSLPKLLVLAVIALVVFGPNELPKMAAKAGKALRELRRIAEGAKADLQEGLGPEFAEFDIDDLNPRHFVQKHLLSDLNEMNGHDGGAAPASYPPRAAPPCRPCSPAKNPRSTPKQPRLPFQPPLRRQTTASRRSSKEAHDRQPAVPGS